ncbi:MAG: PEP-CTERM system TPR-repeat protein PrsT, partial [Halioglobus sp.]|nr:PEP-CTERM system TPR-repeat protein PrsT [Halioglobus sp.]
MSTTLRCIALTCSLLALAGCGGKSVEELVAQAEQHLASGDYKSATVELKNALQRDGANPRARWLLGRLYLDTGNLPSAEKELRRARELGWDANDTTPALARAQLAQGEYAEVAALSGDGLEAPAAAQLLAAQALAQLALGQTAYAEELVAAAFDKAPDSVDAKMAEARVLATRGDATGALIVLEEVLGDAPKLAAAWSLKGDILMRQQILPEAVAAFDQAIALQKNNFADRLKRAMVNLQQHDFEAAQADATVLLKAAPQHPASNYVQGILHFQNKQYAQAITALSVAEPAADQYPLTLFYLGSAHFMEGNRDQAALFASRFVKRLPDNVAGRKLLALLRLQQGRFTEVQELVQPVLDRNPDDVGALNIMANALLRDGKTEEGLALLTRVAELQPDSPAAQVRLGAGLLMTGRDDEAIEHMEMALTLDPEFQQADILLVMNQLRKQDFDGAIEAAKAFRRRNPGQVTPHNLLGKVYLASGRTEEARASFNKALELDPGDPAANHSLAAMAVEAGDPTAARRYYQTILEHHEDSLSALLQLAALDAR